MNFDTKNTINKLSSWTVWSYFTKMLCINEILHHPLYKATSDADAFWTRVAVDHHLCQRGRKGCLRWWEISLFKLLLVVRTHLLITHLSVTNKSELRKSSRSFAERIVLASQVKLKASAFKYRHCVSKRSLSVTHVELIIRFNMKSIPIKFPVTVLRELLDKTITILTACEHHSANESIAWR